MKINKPNIGFFLILIALLVIKWPHLDLPLFWDELGVYGRAVFYLIDNGISPLPSALPPELSRGHPTLFVTIHAAVMRLFGETIYVGHLFSLFLSGFYLLGIYKLGTFIKSKITGLIAVGIFVIQPVFLAQAHLILPEILLGACFIWAFYAYLKGNWIMYIIWTSIGILTKETAILIPCVVVTTEVGYKLFGLKEKINIKYMCLGLVPLLTFGMFLMIQKIQNGWFFFPYHLELISYDWVVIQRKMERFIRFLFVDQGRFLWGVVLLLSIGAIIKKMFSEIEKKWALIVLVSFLGIFVFTCINFYMDRYLFIILGPVVVLLSLVLVRFGVYYKRRYMSVVIAICIAFPALFYYTGDQYNYDVDMSYLSVIEANRMGVKEFRKEIYRGKKVYANFPMFLTVKDHRLGYVKEGDELIGKLSSNFNENYDYYFFSNPGALRPLPKSFHVFEMIKYDFAKVNVFWVKRN